MLIRSLVVVCMVLLVSAAQADDKSAELAKNLQHAAQNNFRMTLACRGDKWCKALVNQAMTLEVAYYKTAHTSGLFAALPYIQGVVDIRDILDRDCPGVWAAKGCPEGNCESWFPPEAIEELRRNR